MMAKRDACPTTNQPFPNRKQACDLSSTRRNSQVDVVVVTVRKHADLPVEEEGRCNAHAAATIPQSNKTGVESDTPHTQSNVRSCGRLLCKGRLCGLSNTQPLSLPAGARSRDWVSGKDTTNKVQHIQAAAHLIHHTLCF